MVSRSLCAVLAACSWLFLLACQSSQAIDVYFDGGTGGTGTAYNLDANWGANPPAGTNNFMPDRTFDELAVIGYDDPLALMSPTVTLTSGGSNPPIPGGLYLGRRERSTVTGNFVNPDPAPGALVGRLTITGGRTLTTQGQSAADGRVLVGSDGRGELTLDGGNLTVTNSSLSVGGEEFTDPNGALFRSRLTTRGTSNLNVTGGSPNGAINLDRDLRIEGPNVTWNSSGRLTLSSTNRYTAVITSPTAHSRMNTGNIAVLNGSINVEFSGAGASGHVIGETWDLVNATFGIAGSFTNLVGPNKEVPVTGLASPQPEGTGYRLQTVSGPGEFQKTLQLVYQNYLVLEVNQATGEMRIRNLNGGTVPMDAYSITSARGSLLSTYGGVQGSGIPIGTTGTWAFPPGANSVNALTEIKTPDFTPPNVNSDVFAVAGDVSLGTNATKGFNPLGVAANVANFGQNGQDLIFEYTSPNGGVIQGPVKYIGDTFENNLLLRVNPTSGNAVLKNESMETLTFDGFEILSSTGSLNTNTFSMAGLGAGWFKSPTPNPTASNSLTLTNPTGSITLDPNESVSIGDIGAFTTLAQRDGLSMNFILSVSLEGTGITPGDFDEDGDVDGVDFLRWQRGLSPGGPLNTTDLANWEANYGSEGGGNPPEEDYRPATVLFDLPAIEAAIAAVPEPTAGLLMLLGMTSLTRRCRRKVDLGPVAMSAGRYERNTQKLGARTMARQTTLATTLAATCCLVFLAASPAEAVTGGANMTNIRFEEPGPLGTKVVAFDPNGVPIPNIIPGWTFSGPGIEVFNDPNGPGDSGTEGNAPTATDNELLLSTLDGTVYQTSATPFFPASQLSSFQQYVFTFTARDVFTLGPDPNGPVDPIGYTGQNRNQLSVTLTYGDARTPLTTPFTYLLSGTDTQYQIVLPFDSPFITAPVLGQKVGIQFDNTSIEYDNNPANDPNNAFDVEHAWAHIDDVLIEITGVIEGDLNGSGAVDLDDYFIIRDAQQTSVDFLAQGDLVRDGFVDLRDFRAWTLLPGVVSSGVLERIALIPEPTSLTLLLGMAAMFSVARRGRRPQVWLLVLVVLAGAVSLPSKSHAALLLYDPFLIGSDPNLGHYTVGPLAPTNEAGGSVGNQRPNVGPFLDPVWRQNFNGVGETNQASIRATGLSYLGAPVAGGAHTGVPVLAPPPATPGTLNGNMRQGRYLTTPWDATTTGTYYISYLVNYGTGDYSDGVDNNDMGFRTVEFWNDTGTVGSDASLSMTIGYSAYNTSIGSAQQDPRTARMFLRVAGTDTIIDGSPASFQADTATHLIVVKFTLSDQPDQDAIRLFLDPTELDEPVIPSAERTGLNFTLGSIGGMNLFGGFGTPGNGEIIMPTMDELRVATTFLEAIPEFPLKGDCCGFGPVNGNPDGPDDRVDIEDYTAIFNHMNQSGVDPWEGDVTGDGKVTIADYRLWKDNRTDLPNPHPPLTAAGTVVPEPNAIALALLGALAFGSARRKK